MAIENRLRKLEQQAAHACPTCGRPNENNGTPSSASRKEQMIQRLLDKGYSQDEAQEMYTEAEKRAREYA